MYIIQSFSILLYHLHRTQHHLSQISLLLLTSGLVFTAARTSLGGGFLGVKAKVLRRAPVINLWFVFWLHFSSPCFFHLLPLCCHLNMSSTLLLWEPGTVLSAQKIVTFSWFADHLSVSQHAPSPRHPQFPLPYSTCHFPLALCLLKHQGICVFIMYPHHQKISSLRAKVWIYFIWHFSDIENALDPQ